MKKLYYLITFLFLVSSVDAQKLVSYEYKTNVPASVISIFLSQLSPSYDVDAYKVTYLTTDALGVEHEASGLVAVPQSSDALIFPIATYMHGTVADRTQVPSSTVGNDYLLSMGLGSYGYVVAAPDYVGLGDSPGIHPYVHAATEASSGVDLVLAAREMIAELDGVAVNDQLFITGYSQGGHSAMAMQREVELNQQGVMEVTASAPMSGPYSVSDKMVEFTLSDEPYGTVAYLAWLVLGYQTAYPTELEDWTLEDIFQPDYIADIKRFRDEEIDLVELNTILQTQLVNTIGEIVPKNIVKPEIVDALFNDPSHPLSIALADNDVFDWAPQAPTILLYCQGDEQVTYQNAIIAEETMQANGAADVTAIRKDTDASPLTHSGCAIPAALEVLDFFGLFSSVEVSGLADFSNNPDTQIYAFGNQLNVMVDDASLQNLNLSLYDMQARELITADINRGKNAIELALGSPMQLIAVLSADGKPVNITKVQSN